MSPVILEMSPLSFGETFPEIPEMSPVRYGDIQTVLTRLVIIMRTKQRFKS